MRLSKLLLQTRREAPADIDLPGLQFLVRGGFVHSLGAGLYGWLPLGWRVLERLYSLAAEDLRAFGGQPIALPGVAPVERYPVPVGLDTRFDDVNGRELALTAVYAQPFLAAAGTQVRSYRQLPQLLFHHAPSWQDSARPRAGLCGARAGFVLEAYGLHSTLESRQEQAGFLGELVQRWFNHWQLPAAVMPGDGGPAAESAQDWFLRLPGGGDQTLACPACGYAASSQAAEFKRNKPENTEEPLPLQEVATPACPTIESLARFLGVSEARTAKAVFVMVRHRWKANAKEELIFAVVRGDRALNETRLLRLLGGSALRPASSEEIERIGACPGYASPVSLRGVRVVVDSEIPLLSNLVAGANKTGYHLLNVNYGRDYTAALVAPIAAAQAGDPCPTCGKALELVEGAVLAQQVQYSAEFSSGQDCAVIDESGKSRPVLLECLRLHTSRAVGCLAELHRDASGLCWLPGTAPFDVHVVALPGKTLDITPALTGLEHQLAAAGIDVLVDDRSESPGVKFADADLLGIPIRVTLGERGLQQGMIEVKIRKSGEKSQVALAEAANTVKEMVC